MPSRAATPPQLPRIKSGDPRKENEKNATKKLNTLAHRFDGFEDALTLAKNKRKDENEKRFEEVHKLIVDVKTSLALEAKNRAISVNAVQSWLSDRIEQWTDEVEKPIHKKIADVNERITDTLRQLDELKAEHAEDRRTFPKLIDARAQELLEQIRDMRVVVEHNAKQREEREHQIMVKIQQQSDRMQEQVTAEKMMKEEQLRVLRTEIEREVDIRAKGYNVLKQSLYEETTEIKAAADRERQEREQQHAEVLQAINHYAAALQDGIKVVGLDQ